MQSTNFEYGSLYLATLHYFYQFYFYKKHVLLTSIHYFKSDTNQSVQHLMKSNTPIDFHSYSNVGDRKSS